MFRRKPGRVSRKNQRSRTSRRQGLSLETLESRELLAAHAAAIDSDFGDAPDGAPTGYPVGFEAVGDFPSLAANGGAVVLDTGQAVLGQGVTVEADSNQAGDVDDGIVNFVLPLTSIPPTAVMSVEVTGPAGSLGGTFWVNVLVDLNLDGEWNGVVGVGLNEWAVINFPVQVAEGVTTEIVLPAFSFGVPPGNGLPDGAWMRIALTDSLISPTGETWDGSGTFAAGEIEDHVILIPDLGDDPDEPKSFIPTVTEIPKTVFFRRGERTVLFGGRYSNIGTTAGTGGFDLDRQTGGVQITRWQSNVFNACMNNPAPDVTCTTGTLGAGGFGNFTFEALRGNVPSRWTWRGYGIDPPAVILPGGVIVGFTESVGSVEFLAAPDGDTGGGLDGGGDGLVTWEDLALVEEMLGRTAVRQFEPPVVLTFETPEELTFAANSGSVGLDHDSVFSNRRAFDANYRDGALVGNESLRITNPSSDTVLDTFWTSASEGEFPFTVGLFVSPEQIVNGSYRLFGANTAQDGWQVNLVDLGDGLMAFQAAPVGEFEELIEVIVPNNPEESAGYYVALAYGGSGQASLHLFRDGAPVGSAEGSLSFIPTDASLTLGGQPGASNALAGTYDDFAIWDDELAVDFMHEIAAFGVEESTMVYLEGDADANGIVDDADLEIVTNAIGDLNEDGAVNESDIHTLRASMRAGETRFDFNQDDIVDMSDVDFYVQDVLKTNYGDTNLDGVFNSADLVNTFQGGKFETESPADWGDGDWNLDGVFNTQDLILALQAGVYSANAKGTVPTAS